MARPGDAYESLLAKGAEDIKSGAGQYFTPRPLIQAMVDVPQPTARDTVMDPAAGTGGFLVAHEYATRHAEDRAPEKRDRLRDGWVHGIELVDGTARPAAMNLLLHGIGKAYGESLIEVKDALLADPGRHWSVVLSNPPFGRKSSLTMVGAGGRRWPPPWRGRRARATWRRSPSFPDDAGSARGAGGRRDRIGA